jgi:hypothetical protein
MPDCSDPLEDRYRVRMALMERFGFAGNALMPQTGRRLHVMVLAAKRGTPVDLPVRGCQLGAGSWYRLAMRPTKSAASASASRPR